MLKFLITLVFLISIWTTHYIVVSWEGIPTGDTQVFCSVDGAYTFPKTIELTRFTWTNNSQDGEWIAYYNFLEPLYDANCLGYLDNHPVTTTATGRGFNPDSYLIFLPLMRGYR